MDLANLPDELERSKSKIAKIDQRTEIAQGWGATTSGKALINTYHDRLTEGFRSALLDAHGGQKNQTALVVLLRGLSPELLALVSIQTLLHSIARQCELVVTLKTLGTAVANECWAKRLTEDKTDTTGRLVREASGRYSTASRRRAALAKSVDKAIKAGTLMSSFKDRYWEPTDRVTAGAWLWNVVSSSLPEVFIRVCSQEGPTNKRASIALSESSWAIVGAALDRAMLSRPVYWPTPDMPKPWTYWNDGGSWDDRVNASVLRSHHKDTQASVKHAIKSGQMKPALDALNALQSVPYRINVRVLEVLEACDAQGIQVDGIAPANLEYTPKPLAWDPHGQVSAASLGA